MAVFNATPQERSQPPSIDPTHRAGETPAGAMTHLTTLILLACPADPGEQGIIPDKWEWLYLALLLVVCGWTIRMVKKRRE